MCSHFLGEEGTFICGVCLKKISRESPIMHFCCCKKQIMVTKYRDLGGTFSTRYGGGGGGVQMMRNEERSPDSAEVGGGGER